LQPRAFGSFIPMVCFSSPARAQESSRVACHSLVHLPTEHAFHASWSGMFLRTRQRGNNAFPSCCRHALICAGKCLLILQPHGWHASRVCGRTVTLICMDMLGACRACIAVRGREDFGACSSARTGLVQNAITLSRWLPYRTPPRMP